MDKAEFNAELFPTKKTLTEINKKNDVNSRALDVPKAEGK